MGSPADFSPGRDKAVGPVSDVSPDSSSSAWILVIRGGIKAGARRMEGRGVAHCPPEDTGHT